MASRKAKVTVHECDDSTCHVVHYTESSAQEMPIGIYGRVNEVSGAGGSSEEFWYACSSQHISGAIKGALARAWGHEQEDIDEQGEFL